MADFTRYLFVAPAVGHRTRIVYALKTTCTQHAKFNVLQISTAFSRAFTFSPLQSVFFADAPHSVRSQILWLVDLVCKKVICDFFCTFNRKSARFLFCFCNGFSCSRQRFAGHKGIHILYMIPCCSLAPQKNRDVNVVIFLCNGSIFTV